MRVDPDGTSREAADDLQFPNGAVITEDGGTLIIAESFGGRLTAFDRAADGTLTNRRVWAVSGGHRPRRHLPLCRRLRLGGQRARRRNACAWPRAARSSSASTTSMNCYACMLGDDDRRTLYMVTAVDSNAAVARATRNGALEKVRTTVPGAGLP